MGILYLVRHGQASFGADNYDRLSPLGQRQCERLGAWFRQRGQRFEAALTGTLVRHDQSYQALRRGLGEADLPAEPLRLPGLNEYNSEALIATVHAGPLVRPDTPELFRHYFLLLRQGLAKWMAAEAQPAGMPSYADFVAGVAGALDHVRRNHAGDVLLVSSGGPISTAVGQVLGTPAEVTIDLNMRLRNSALTEFVLMPKRHVLLSFNTLSHLEPPLPADQGADAPPAGGWVTYI